MWFKIIGFSDRVIVVVSLGGSSLVGFGFFLFWNLDKEGC